MSETLLDNFLSIASENLTQGKPKRQLKETNLFNQESNTNQQTTESENVRKTNKLLNVVHSGDTDSSDDDDNKYYEDRKYNECGRDIKHLLKTTTLAPSSSNDPSLTWKSKPNSKQPLPQQRAPTKTQDTYTDPIFGLRIVNPLVSFATLQERMVGREAVVFSKIKTFVTGNISDKNWVIAGVVVNKSPVRTSQKGNQFLIWTLSDLRDDIKTISVFLFGNAYKELWKTATGTVVGILNPNVFEKKDNSKDEGSLSVDNAQKVMILGQSKDLGKCKSVKKNGEKCNAVVNINRCEYCIYHIKQEYQKCSRRSELQSNFAGRGLTALRNKVLGKNEVFYAGKLYTAIPAKRSRKLEEKDESLLQALSGTNIHKQNGATKVKKKIQQRSAANIEVTQQQRLKDLMLLEKLGDTRAPGTFNASHSAEATLETSKKIVTDVLAKLKDNKASKTSIDTNFSKNDTVLLKEDKVPISSLTTMNIPLLPGSGKGMIDLDAKVTPKQMNRAKLNALNFIQKNGPLKKSDPNSVKKPTENRKRVMESIDDQKCPLKKQKVENEFLSDRFKKIMAASSKHSDILNEKDNEEQEKYFHKLEVKEKMEEKMIHTYKVPCKAVRCLQCKYTNFSASQFCKENKHALKVFDAVKRFFKCGNCGNRTQSLEVVPTIACKNCGSGKWERTGMMKEKNVEVGHKLSIRGGEQKFVNSVANNANLDLLMPDE